MQYAPYEPRGAALQLMRSRDLEIVIAGGAGSGKSRADQEKAHLMCLKHPGYRVLFTRKTRSSMSNTTLVTFETQVLPPGFRMGNASREVRRTYNYPNGSSIDILGLDRPDRILSSEYDMIVVGEATEVEEGDWQTCISRLRNNRVGWHQIIGDTNPGAPTHWIKRREAEGHTLVLESKLSDNPRYHDGTDWTEAGKQYLETLGRLTGHRKQRLLYGQWVAVEGGRWEFLNPEEHCFKARELWPHGRPDHDILIGIDYGIRAPYCATWLSVDENGDFFAFREDYRAGLSAHEQGQAIVSLTGENERIREVFADPNCWSSTARDGAGRTTSLTIADYYDRALRADPHRRFRGVSKGGHLGEGRHALANLDALLMRNNGQPDLWIDKDACPNLWREFTEAIWDDRNGGREDIHPSCAEHGITSVAFALTRRVAPTRSSRGLVTWDAVYQVRQEDMKRKEQRAFEARFAGSRFGRGIR